MSTRTLHAANLFLRRNLALAALSVQRGSAGTDPPKDLDATGIGAARPSPGEITQSRNDA